MLITQVIEAGIKWLLCLLIPGAGFIMAIKDVIVFFVESAIMLIPSLIEAIMALAAGSVAGVAKAIELGLGRLIPLVIGLLANLIGLGGLAKRVMKIFKKIRKRVDKMVNKLLAKAKKAGRKLFNKLRSKKKGKKGAAKKIKEENKKGPAEPLTAEDKQFHAKIGGLISKKLEEPAKDTKDFKAFYQEKKKQADQLEDKYQPQLKKGINLDITIGTLAQEEKDDDLDFHIKIAPNNFEKDVPLKNPVTKVSSADLNLTYGDGKSYNIELFAENDKELLARIRAVQNNLGTSSVDVEQKEHSSGNLATGKLMITGKLGDNLKGGTSDKLLTIPLLNSERDELIVYVSSIGMFKPKEFGSNKLGKFELTIKNADETNGEDKSLVIEKIISAAKAGQKPAVLGGNIKLKLGLVQGDIGAIMRNLLEVTEHFGNALDKNNKPNSLQNQHSEPAVYLALQMRDAEIADQISRVNFLEIYDAALHIHSELDMCKGCAEKGHGLITKLPELAPLTSKVLKEKMNNFEKLRVLVTSHFTRTDIAPDTFGDTTALKEEIRGMKSHLSSLERATSNVKGEILNELIASIEDTKDKIELYEMHLRRKSQNIFHEEIGPDKKKYKTKKDSDFDTPQTEILIKLHQGPALTDLPSDEQN
jgi:hypothetical protein